MKPPSDPSRASVSSLKATDAKKPAHRPNGPVAAREWDVAHAAALRALLTEPPAVLPNQVGDPLLPLHSTPSRLKEPCCWKGIGRLPNGLWRCFLCRRRSNGRPDGYSARHLA